MKLGIVCGYGSELDKNLERYVDAVQKYTKQYLLNTLVLTGGYSYRISTFTEAELMHKLLSEKDLDIELLLETKSITTLHNLLYSKELIEASRIEIDEIHIFCDSIRYLKVLFLSKLIFREFSPIVISVDRGETILIYLIQLPSIIFQALGIIFPVIEKKVLQSKQAWINKYR